MLSSFTFGDRYLLDCLITKVLLEIASLLYLCSIGQNYTWNLCFHAMREHQDDYDLVFAMMGKIGRRTSVKDSKEKENFSLGHSILKSHRWSRLGYIAQYLCLQ